MAPANRLTYEVHLDAPELGVRRRVGTLYRHEVRTDVAAAFEYDQDWLKSDRAFELDPRLALYRGEQHPPVDIPAFGVFMDSAPDRWGRVLMERREAASAAREGRKMRRFQEMDFLLGVYDHTRMGGLRLCQPGGPFLDHNENAAPPVTDLQELAYISKRVEEPGVEQLPEYERWLALLIAPGTSLGGARPKANFTDDDKRLWIAKFPAKDDRYDVGGWEYLMHVLARKAGIVVPEARMEALSERYHTFCSARFDRVAEGRRMYASAMTLLERKDGETGASYLDLAEYISDHGAQGHIAEDLAQLFRRVLFNIMVGNRDDHLRNHGFIREPSGWRLSPAFDINPSTVKQTHALAIDSTNAEPDLAIALEQAELYRLTHVEAGTMLDEVRDAISDWRAEAKKLALPSVEIQRMESVIQA
ncbi:type II toxin-antitoxin system HipA family toxin [Paraburkholderia sacchari]|uniref:type II toxin-antitoxin system HipA family toxin n=1 Tax=Paraburkholderia sacchari TaxID=159450 RepID=UPI001BCAD8D5|nr:type II toxin-antitoxin system HipA family toxin [Paraburkholderia sacchari]